MKRISAAALNLELSRPSGAAGLGSIYDRTPGSYTGLYTGESSDGGDFEDVDENGYPVGVLDEELDEPQELESGMFNVPDEDDGSSDAGAGLLPVAWWLSENSGSDDVAPGSNTNYGTDGEKYNDPILMGETYGGDLTEDDEETSTETAYGAGYAQGFADASANKAKWTAVPSEYEDDPVRYRAGYDAGYAAGLKTAGGGGVIAKPPIKTTGGGTPVKTTGGATGAADDETDYTTIGLVVAGVAAAGAVAFFALRKKKGGKRKRRSKSTRTRSGVRTKRAA